MRKPHKDPELERLRDEILAADRALLAAFGKRLEVARRIREHKRERGYQMIDPAREDELYRRWRESAASDISADGLRTLFETVLGLSKQEAWRDGEPSA
ncbi:MAG: chorismate mutase [Gaiellaceae bacterium]